ncbi:hypothetical protein KIN20_007349 [Parelaphostrongylus tenuis]|uniref:Uncharacterized protein n=1 Tax=Parelaphostrongylus tenuis TaxID=148309 RepID=A0AAD5QLY8_PARTN|nr:hypothetical protein KIN20_007349 [Parelaphostrongylus tenuis]
MPDKISRRITSPRLAGKPKAHPASQALAPTHQKKKKDKVNEGTYGLHNDFQNISTQSVDPSDQSSNDFTTQGMKRFASLRRGAELTTMSV